ncbi:hypothetical protein E4U53_001389 [Claviceps sorghi]|nr:hypothetical protein E4U53_001389 [Claviceps sorghi]
MSAARLEMEANKARIRNVENEILHVQRMMREVKGRAAISGSMSPRTKEQRSDSASSANYNRGKDDTLGIEESEQMFPGKNEALEVELQQLHLKLNYLESEERRLAQKLKVHQQSGGSN